MPRTMKLIILMVFVLHSSFWISIEARSTTEAPPVCPGSHLARDVFLGGSCNPTTWRRDAAIPLLGDLGISYYNPQVAAWSPDLILEEHEAKRLARFLFFVLNQQTRNTASMMEAAQLAISRRESLVVVINSYQAGQRISGEVITARENEDLRNGLQVVQYFLERQRIPIYMNLNTALNDLNQALRDGSDVQVLQPNDELSSDSDTDNSDIIDIIAFRELFNSIVTNESPAVRLRDALRVLQRRRGISTDPPCHRNGGIPNAAIRLNFEDFCTLARQYFMSTSALPFGEADIYIGVEGEDRNWMINTAALLIESSGFTLIRGVSYNYSPDNLPDELQRIASSRIILLIIPAKLRALGISALAAHLIGLGMRNIVLCIQRMPDHTTINGELLTPLAIADYNRGRSYLESFARSANIRVYRNTDAALQRAMKLAEKIGHVWSFVSDLFLHGEDQFGAR